MKSNKEASIEVTGSISLVLTLCAIMIIGIAYRQADIMLRLFLAAGGSVMLGVASITVSKGHKELFRLVYCPVLVVSILASLAFVFKNSGSSTLSFVAIGALVLVSIYGFLMIITRRNMLTIAHAGLAALPILLVDTP